MVDSDETHGNDGAKSGPFRAKMGSKPEHVGMKGDESRDDLLQKIEWYETILDAIPFPLSVTDPDMKWTFINRATENFLKVKRNDIVGQHCSTWNANICNTDQCTIELLKQGKNSSDFEQGGGYFHVDGAYLKTSSGEFLGHIEVVQDFTARVKVEKYTQNETEKIIQVLNKLSAGNTRVEITAEVSDEDTKSTKKTFDGIAQAITTCANAIHALVTDAGMLEKAAVEGKLDTRADASKHQGDYRVIVEGVNSTLDSVIGPLNVAAEYVDRISKGDIPPKITDPYKGDFNEIKNNLNACIDGLQGLVEANNVLGRMAVNDHSKGVEGNYVGLFAEVKVHVNEVRERLRGVTKQINEIAMGDTKKLEELKRVGKRSEQDHLLPAIINCLEVVDLLIKDTAALVKAAEEGKLDTRADVSRHVGEYKTIIQGINNTLDAVIGPLNVAAEYVDRISKGEIPAKITDKYNGDFNEIKNNLNACIDAINGLVADANMLGKAAVEGKLDTRADATKHLGDYRKIVEGVNGTLDAVIGPLNVAAEYVDRISKGEIPAKITDKYNGDFNEIKNNLNACIDGLQGLLEANAVLARMAQNDHSIGVEGTYMGVFAETKTSVNTVRGRVNRIADALVKISDGDLSEADEYRKIGKRSEADRLVPAFVRTYDALEALTNDANMLVKAAVEGKLDTRADATKHQGDYRKIVEGVNSTLDAVIGPLNVAAEYVDRISKGEIPAKITDKYNGDFNEIKNNLNNCIDAINGLVADANMLAKAAVEGKLDTRADATRHQGDYKKIVQGVDDCLDAVIGPLNVAAEYVDRISKRRDPG